MDLLLEKWNNFPEARQLGDESARFIRGELEATWGQSHLAILSKEEAQKWLLGVSIYIFFWGTKVHFGSCKNCHNILQGTIGRLNTKNKQDTPFPGPATNYMLFLYANFGVP